MIIASPPTLAASFTLGCMVIHAAKRDAQALTTMLTFVVVILALFVGILWLDSVNPVALEQTFLEMGENSKTMMGVE